MTTIELQRARVGALADQAWMAWTQHLPDIERIANSGPTTPQDMLLVRGVFSMVAGDMHIQLHDRRTLDVGETNEHHD